jgi:hypothetical protein
MLRIAPAADAIQALFHARHRPILGIESGARQTSCPNPQSPIPKKEKPMFRDSMTGNRALATFEAMLMIFASLFALAEAGARVGRIPAWGARPRQWFPQADAPVAPGRRRGSPREARPPRALRLCLCLRAAEPGPETGRPVIYATPFLMRDPNQG